MYGMTACASTIGKKGQIDDPTDEKWCQKGIYRGRGEQNMDGMTACASTKGQRDDLKMFY